MKYKANIYRHKFTITCAVSTPTQHSYINSQIARLLYTTWKVHKNGVELSGLERAFTTVSGENTHLSSFRGWLIINWADNNPF